MSKIHVSFTSATATVTIAAVAAVLAVALIAASLAHAAPTPGTCPPVGTTTGGPGNDTICGTQGNDTLDGQAGDDKISGGAGDDTLFGRIGNDTLDGGDGLDVLSGGSGNDILIGGPGGFPPFFGERFDGGSGSDQLRARDGAPDSLTNNADCGSGTDSLDMDLLDAAQLTGLLGISLLFSSCEHISVGAVNEGPNVVISRHSANVRTDGRAAVRLRCPGSLTAPCAGTLRLGHSAKSQGKKAHYSIDQGKKDDVSARLSHRDRRRLRRHGETTARVTSVEQGQFGDKTTVQTIKLIAED
jgi:hypothetical protein